MPELRRSTRVAAASEPPAKKAKKEDPDTEGTEKSEPNSEPKPEDSKPKEPKLKELQVGDKIPELTLLDENEEEIDLIEAASKTKYLVIFAYPKASTPGCTRQANGFEKNREELKKLNTTVFGLSADKPKLQLNFVTKQGLKYTLLSDPEKKLIGALGAKKSPSGIKRSHWIFENGVLKVKKIQISPEVSVNSALDDIKNFEENDGKDDDEKDDKEDVKEE